MKKTKETLSLVLDLARKCLSISCEGGKKIKTSLLIELAASFFEQGKAVVLPLHIEHGTECTDASLILFRELWSGGRYNGKGGLLPNLDSRSQKLLGEANEFIEKRGQSEITLLLKSLKRELKESHK